MPNTQKKLYFNNLEKALQTLYHSQEQIKTENENDFNWSIKDIESMIKEKNYKNINLQDKNGNTPLFIIASEISNNLYNNHSYRETMEKNFIKLLKNKADVNIKNENDITLLLEAIAESNTFVYETLLKHPKTEYSYISSDRHSLLSEAALEHHELIPTLLEKGTPLTNKDLYIIIEYCPESLEKVNIFEQKNTIDINKENNNGMTLLMTVISHIEIKDDFPKYKHILNSILEHPDLDINYVNNNNNTALFEVIDVFLNEDSSFELLECFFKRNDLNWNIINHDQKTPLFTLLEQHLFLECENLAHHIFPIIDKTDLNHQDEEGNTALIYFIETSYQTNNQISEALLFYILNNPEIDLSIQNNDNKNIFQIVSENEYVLEDLLKHSFSILSKNRFDNNKKDYKKPKVL